MEDDTERRIASNEARFREVNEAIARGQWPGEGEAAVGFRCECATLGCNRVIELAPEEYERIRGHARRFLVLPGHQRLEVEKVVETRPTYLVIEKSDEAGEHAEETDPRT
ncbi:MAG TPA: hypothetical protein VG295_04425 [Solirubrobacteraceae bacterium]|jgi:hypothetical protein|nr:hypothetical protein [Solirubrobacteraceae bacterium]